MAWAAEPRNSPWPPPSISPAWTTWWSSCAGTDGTDGPTDAAGAVADGETLGRKPDARRYLDRNDSYHYFEALDDLMITGPTNTNVMDVRIVLVGSTK